MRRWLVVLGVIVVVWLTLTLVFGQLTSTRNNNPAPPVTTTMEEAWTRTTT